MAPKAMRGRPKALEASGEELAHRQFLDPIVNLNDIPSNLNISRASFFRYRKKWNPRILKVGIEDTLQSTQWAYQKKGAKPETTNYDIEIARLLAFELRQRVHLVPLPFYKMTQALKEGKLDFCLGWHSDTKERVQDFSFTEEYIPSSEKRCYFYGSLDKPVMDVKTILSGAWKVGVQRGTLHELYLRKHFARQDKLKTFSLEAKMFEQLNAGKIAFCLSHFGAVRKTFSEGKIKICTVDIQYDHQTGILVNKDHTELYDRLSKSLEKIKFEGDSERVSKLIFK